MIFVPIETTPYLAWPTHMTISNTEDFHVQLSTQTNLESLTKKTMPLNPKQASPKHHNLLHE